MGSAVTPDLSKGGTIDGDISITGDFKVEGGVSFTYDEIIEGSLNVETSINGLLANFNQTHASGLGMLIKATGSGSSEYLLKLQGNAGSTEAMFVGKDGKVGIGTTSPDGTAHIHSATAGSVSAHADADELTIEGSGHSGLTI